MMSSVILIQAIAMIGTTAAVGTTTTMYEKEHMQGRVLYSFDGKSNGTKWINVNDTVMGGVSDGRWGLTPDGALCFHGTLSLENNGGFATARSRGPSLDLSEYDGLLLRVRGDGKRYRLSIRTDFAIMAGGYYFMLETEAGQWQEIFAPFSLFEARAFGRKLPGAPQLNKKDVRSLGFMISDKQEGEFRLEVDWIKAVKAVDESKTTDNRLVTKSEIRGGSHATTAAQLINQAIARGVPMFNGGQHDACAAVYETAADSIVALAADELASGVVDVLRAALAKARQTTDPVERAWILRRAFDASLRMLSETQ